MSFTQGLFNPQGGSNFSGSTPDLMQTTNAGQINEQYANNQQALQQQQAFAQAVQAQNGLGNQSSVFNQLQGVANGTGPNPAQAQLQQQTGINTANQAALMAGQRGSSANTGLIARQAAQQGAANQQNAIGQGATLQAQQSLGALNQLGGIAGQQVGQQASATGAYTQAAQNEQQQILNAAAAKNAADAGVNSNINTVNGSLANVVAGGQANLLGNSASGAGKAAVAAFAQGGQVHDVKSPRSKVGQHFHSPTMQFAQGGKVPALVSPGEQYLDPKDVSKVEQGANPLAVGKKVPGKPEYSGNDYRNDTVPATLKEGGVVIPNKIMQSKDASAKAKKFIEAILTDKAHTKSRKK